MSRLRPNNRRLGLAASMTHDGQRFRLQAGFFENGQLAEVFLNAARQDSPIDAAILISLLIQRGATLDEIGHALRRDRHGTPASLIGATVRALGSLVEKDAA